MNKLAVVTFTRNLWPEWKKQCILSVRKALPSYGKHYVLDGTCHWQRLKWESLQLAEYVCFVDDDDIVEPWAISACVEALDETGAGLAFTYEGRIDKDGNALEVKNRPIIFQDIFRHPRAAHHLSVIRRSSLEPKVIEAAETFGCGVDWFSNACAAANGGAVQLLKVGYQWRLNPNGMSSSPEEAQAFRNNMISMRNLALTWVKPNLTLKHIHFPD